MNQKSCDDRDYNAALSKNSFRCPVCSSLLSSLPCDHPQVFVASELDEKFEEGQSPSIWHVTDYENSRSRVDSCSNCSNPSRKDCVCEEQLGKSFCKDNCNDEESINYDTSANNCCKRKCNTEFNGFDSSEKNCCEKNSNWNDSNYESEESEHISEFQSECKINEDIAKDSFIVQFQDDIQYCSNYNPCINHNVDDLEEVCTAQSEDNIQYCTNYNSYMNCSPSVPCNATNTIISRKETCMRIEKQEENKMEDEIPFTKPISNSCYEKMCCVGKNISIETQTSTSSLKRAKRIPTLNEYSGNTLSSNKTSKIFSRKSHLLKSEEVQIFNVKICTSSDCEYYANNRKTILCNTKKNLKYRQPQSKNASSTNNPVHNCSFKNGWNNLKNALASYLQNKISPDSSNCKCKENHENECRPSDHQKEVRNLDFEEEKQRRNVIKQNSQPREFCLKISNNSRSDSNPERYSQSSRCNKIKVEAEDYKKEINRSSSEALVTVQPEMNADLVFKNDMQASGNKEMLNSCRNTDVSFQDESTVIENDNRMNSQAINVNNINNNLSEFSSNECLVHHRIESYISECEFMKKSDHQRITIDELGHQLNSHVSNF